MKRATKATLDRKRKGRKKALPLTAETQPPIDAPKEEALPDKELVVLSPQEVQMARRAVSYHYYGKEQPTIRDKTNKLLTERLNHL